MADKVDADDPVALGLVGTSYDNLFSVRKRVRKLNDIVIPFRRGLTTAQIGAAVVVFVAAVIFYGVVVVPVMALLGIPGDWKIAAAFLLGPPFLAGQQIAKPMPYGKTINGALVSWMRFAFDDRVHRRGVPIVEPSRDGDVATLHYQREWVAAAEYAQDDAHEQDYSDPETERWLSRDGVIELQGWYDGKAIENLHAEEAANRDRRNADDDDAVHFRRGSAPTVYLPTDDERE